MALFRIERQLPELTQDEIDAAGFRSATCLVKFPDLRWIRSFYDPRALHVTCYYEAQDPDRIRKHAEMAAIPCDSITEVVEVLPETYR